MGRSRYWDGHPVTLDGLIAWSDAVRETHSVGSTVFRQGLLTQIICQFVGPDWFRRYAYIDAEKTSFLHPNFETTQTSSLYTHRLLNLGEMLFNLQMIEGFENCLDQLSSGDIESAMAELQVGMLLYQDLNDIRFMAPRGATGEKMYDLEIKGPGNLTIPAEIKCKEDVTKLSTSTVLNSLSAARVQLPKDGLGVIFLRVPQSWSLDALGSVRVPIEVAKQATDFLRKTKRVAVVIFYMMHIKQHDDHSVSRHGIKALLNPKIILSEKIATFLFPTIASQRWVTIGDIETEISKNIK